MLSFSYIQSICSLLSCETRYNTQKDSVCVGCECLHVFFNQLILILTSFFTISIYVMLYLLLARCCYLYSHKGFVLIIFDLNIVNSAGKLFSKCTECFTHTAKYTDVAVVLLL